ncbi:hypothetical protein [Nostoc sp. C052]|uniref:hypothetical protein n=1 Tax=Nostoc sp. C052 TaxID=2576902 RepID=UPI0015C2FBA6|nr:hypothetical protein [Nostoc sp. C052]
MTSLTETEFSVVNVRPASRREVGLPASKSFGVCSAIAVADLGENSFWATGEFFSGGYDVFNRLVADVFYKNRQEFIQFTNISSLLVETA